MLPRENDDRVKGRFIYVWLKYAGSLLVMDNRTSFVLSTAISDLPLVCQYVAEYCIVYRDVFNPSNYQLLNSLLPW